jgi:methylase of polypeptide subunit release factors
LADTYGLGAQTQWKSKKEKETAYQQWKKSHQPFHWFAEFYEIISKGGFDVVIGNPPYVEYTKAKKDYSIKGYETESCGNLYAFVAEKVLCITNKKGRSGMIIPHSSICTDRMSSFQKILGENGLWLSSYDIRPSKLFDGVDQRLLIFLTDFQSDEVLTSSYHRWNSEYRDCLFNTLEYVSSMVSIPNSIAKINKTIEKNILTKLFENNKKLNDHFDKTGKYLLFYHNTPRYFIRAMKKEPYFWNEKDGKKSSSHNKGIVLSTNINRDLVLSILSSTIFYWWFILHSDCRDLNAKEIGEFPIDLDSIKTNNKSELIDISKRLEEDLKKNSYRKETIYKATGKVIYDEFYPKKSKPIIDEIDKVLAKHYGFTDEELDFIINYDIKYRMGGELEDEE